MNGSDRVDGGGSVSHVVAVKYFVFGVKSERHLRKIAVCEFCDCCVNILIVLSIVNQMMIGHEPNV